MKKFVEKIKTAKAKIAMFSLGLLGSLGLAGSVGATAPTTTATDLIDATAGAGLTTVMDMVVYVVTNYYGYLIAIVIIIAIFGWFKHLAKVGTK